MTISERLADELCGDCEQLDYNGRNIYCAKSGLTMTGAFERIDKCKKESWKQPKAQETA
jgi:hypothetical protein